MKRLVNALTVSQTVRTKKSKKGQTVRATPITRPLTGQVYNSGGGYAYKIDKWKQLLRFLIIGSEGGTFYAGEQLLALMNMKSVMSCIREDGRRVVDAIVDIQNKGRANKKDYSIMALAACFSDDAIESVRQYASEQFTKVIWTGTDLFMFMEAVRLFRTSGVILRRTLSSWYQRKTDDKLAYQLVKYRQREGWTHRDVIRQAHPKPVRKSQSNLIRYAIYGEPIPDVAIIQAYEEAKTADTNRIVELILNHGLPWEAVPSEQLKNELVWSALLTAMPVGAMVRNLGRMTSIGTLKKGNVGTDLVVASLKNQDNLREQKLHPFKLLMANVMYNRGKGDKGSLTWTPVQDISDALSDAFYLSFGTLTPTGKRIALCIDYSGSMEHSSNISSSDAINCRQAAAAMALVTLNVEREVTVYGFSSTLERMPINADMRIDKAMEVIRSYGDAAMTNIALPIEYNIREGYYGFDAFIFYTDGVGNQGKHPQALIEEYRRRSGKNVKAVSVQMTASNTSVFSLDDENCMDVVGFDGDTPEIISNFLLNW